MLYLIQVQIFIQKNSDFLDSSLRESFHTSIGRELIKISKDLPIKLTDIMSVSPDLLEINMIARQTSIPGRSSQLTT